MSNYILDPDMPLPLRNALIASDNEYHEELREYMKDQDHGKFKISATALSKPSQSTVLFKRHGRDLWVDPEADCWHSMRGSVIHYILEKEAAKLPQCMTEVRLGVDLEIDGDLVHVHGKLDLYYRDTKIIQDWKNTSATSMMYDKTDHRIQLNVLYYLMRKNGYDVDKLQDVYLFERLDPTKSKMPGYPKKKYMVVDVEKMSMADIKAHIVNRVRIIRAEHEKPDKKLTPCTDDERWIRGSLFKLYTRKKGGKKGEVQPFSTMAATSSDNMDDILDFVNEKGLEKDNYEVKEIKGKPTGCDYCSVKTVCRQRLSEVLESDKAWQAKAKKK
jgi:hypothetical protein